MFWRRSNQSLNREIEDYLDRETRDNIARGMPPIEARAAAQRKLGNATRVKEETRAAWGWTWIERLWQDLRHARRMFAKNPGFSAVAVLSLAIGVGANCAMFSMADMLLWRPLPVANPAGIVTVGSYTATEVVDSLQISYPDYADLRDRARSFEGLVAYSLARVRFAARAEDLPDVRIAMTVTGNFFEVLGVEPEFGRGFRPEEAEVRGRDPVVVLTYEFWEQEFDADPSILGRQVRINDTGFTVIGVTPEKFTGVVQWIHPAFYIPITMPARLYSDSKSADPMGYLTERDSRFLSVKGRLAPGVGVDQARAEVATIGAALSQSFPKTNRDVRMGVRTEREAITSARPGVGALAAMLMTLAGAVLLVACANIASLLTSRAPARAREMALRLSIGASRPRLVRQLLTESALLGGAGGLLGVGLGHLGVALLDRFTFVSDVPVVLSIELNERSLFFGLAMALLSVFLFGLVPALQTTRTDLVSGLKATVGSVFQKRRFWGRNLLVVGQVATGLVLLAISSFMYIGFRAQLTSGPGFRTDHLLVMEFDPTLVDYTPEKTKQFYRDLTAGVRSLPGVRSAALASFLPMSSGADIRQIAPEGYEFPAGAGTAGVMSSLADESYFETMKIPIVEGRGFRSSDDAEAPRVAVVNQTLGERYWPAQSPLGKRFRLSGGEGPWVEIVGVARDSKYNGLTDPPADFLYLPYAQDPRNDMILMVESAGGAAQLAAPVRNLVRSLDPAQPIYAVRAMKEFFQGGPVHNTVLLIQAVGAMGLMGMVMALIGLYGLVAYAVSTRTREIGIRMAIGADRGSVLRMILRQGVALAVAGVGMGVLLSIGAMRVLVAVFPPPTAGGSGTLLGYALVVPASLAVTLLAAYIPARRASRVDPTVALRYE
jgi:putative ABC transport system permease protein